MRNAVQLALSAVLLAHATQLRAQFQLVHDAPNTTTTPRLTPVMLPDGGVATHHWNTGQHIVRKYDSSGTLLWSRVLPGGVVVMSSGDHASSILSDADGGIILAVLDSLHTYWDLSEQFQDSTVYRCRIVRIDGNGDFSGAWQLKKSYPIYLMGGGILVGFDFERAPDGGMVIAATISHGPLKHVELLKVNANGAIDWCRSIGMPIGSATGPTPTMVYETSSGAKVSISGSGIIYCSVGDMNPAGHFRLAALDTDGTMLWMKRYIYGNTSTSAYLHDVAVDDVGNAHLAGSLISSVGRFHIFLRTSADGVLERTDIYRTPYWNTSGGQFCIDGLGRRYHRVKFVVQITGPISHGILIADTLGSPARYCRRRDEVVLPNNVFAIPQILAAAGDRLAVSSLLHHEDVDLAYTTRYEALSLFTTDDIAPCLMDDTAFAHIAVPLNPVMATEVISTAASVDVSAYFSIQAITLNLAAADAEEVVPLCEFTSELLGVTGVGARASAEALPLIQNTLVAKGAHIQLNADGVAMLEVYERSGALLQRHPLNGQRSLPTTAWLPGLYLIRALDKQGRAMGVGRVVLE